MSCRRAIATLLLPVMAIQFASCHKWSGATDPMQHVRDHDPWHIRVTLEDGEVVELWDAEIADDEIVGFTQRPPRANTERARRERAELPQARFPLDQIERLEDSHFDLAITLAVIVGIGVLLYVLAPEPDCEPLLGGGRMCY